MEPKGKNAAEDKKNDAKKGKRKPLTKEEVLAFMGWMLLGGVILIILYAVKNIKEPWSWGAFWSVSATSAIGIVIGGASLMIGVFMGFLFAIPKAIQSNAIGAAAEQNAGQSTTPPGTPSDANGKKNGLLKTAYRHNDNLVEISDWLTKIIVGVGLTQLNTLPTKLHELGVALGVSFGADSPGQIFSIATVLFFLTDGFLISYLWTRLYFIKMLSEADRDLEEVIEELDEKDTLLQQREAELEAREKELKLKNTELKQKDDSLIETQKQTETLNDFLIKTGSAQDHKRKMMPGDDPQKNQWGGQPERNGYKLEGTVAPVGSGKESAWFKITLRVTSTDANKVLSGTVKFHLHPTFILTLREVPVVDGVAELSLIAYGGFTVGAETGDGTQLELDLAELPDAPELFKQR